MKWNFKYKGLSYKWKGWSKAQIQFTNVTEGKAEYIGIDVDWLKDIRGRDDF